MLLLPPYKEEHKCKYNIKIKMQAKIQMQLEAKKGTQTQFANDQMIQVFIATASTVQT